MRFKTYKTWTTAEERLLREMHASELHVKEFLHLFPERTEKSITSRMTGLNLGPRTNLKPYTVERSVMWTAIERILKDGAQLTTHELADQVHCSMKHARDLVKREHAADAIHIARWRRARSGDSICPWVEIWAYGDGPDAVKPKGRTRTEHVRAQRLRKKMREAADINPFEVAMNQVMRAAA